MTDYERPDESQRPKVGKFQGYDHIVFNVSNAKQAAEWYCIRFGFEIVGFKGLETGSRDIAAFVLQKGDIFFVIQSALQPEDKTGIAEQVAISGDHVHDVSFRVADCEALYEKAIERGAISVHPPIHLTDEDGEVIICKLKTYGNVNHTMIQRDGYKGKFMPGFKPYTKVDPVLALLPDTGLYNIDHIVGNQSDDQMEGIVQWYVNTFDFHRYWSVDDKQICTEYSALRSIVVADFDETIRFPVNEPADGLKKSQIKEFVEWHGVASGIGGATHGMGGAGVQHIALRTDNILSSIAAMRARGMDFLTIPPTYYKDLRERLKKSPVQVTQDLDEVERLGILVDFDDTGYLLQLFSKPAQPKPTLFYEVIQRCGGFNGFGVGNFGALFKALEAEQALRGNL